MKYLIQRLDKTIKSFTSFTRYSLIILVLLTMSCTDKKQITADPIIEEVIEPEILFTNTIVNSDVDTTDPSYTPPEIIKLSYDKGLDLMLVDTSFKQWHGEVVGYEKANQEEKGNWGRYYGYYAMYWDTNTQTYYGVTNNYDWYHGTPITNMQFEYTIDETKQYEAVFYPTIKEVFTNTGATFLYIGSISPLERVYLDPTNQIYYIKYLAPWDTSIYTVYVTEDTCTTNSNTLSIFPASDPYFSNIETNYNQETDTDIISTNNNKPFIFYTNSDGDKFSGIDPQTPMRKQSF